MNDFTNPRDVNIPEPQSYEEAEQGYAQAMARLNAEAVYPLSVPDKEFGEYGASLFTHNFKERKLFFHTDFNTASVQQTMIALHYLASKKVMARENRPRKITLSVSSPGGLVDDGCFMMDLIESIKERTHEPVEVVVEVRAASMGSLLTQSASPGRLFMYMGAMSQSVNMIHSLSYGVGSSKRDAHVRGVGDTRLSMANLYRYYARRMYRTLVEFHGHEPGKELLRDIFIWLKNHMEALDTFLHPVACFEVGIVDFIVLHEHEKMAYDKALDWRDGFWAEETRDGKTTLVRQENRKRLEPEEFKHATERVIELQQKSYRDAKALLERRTSDAWVKGLEALDRRREEESNGLLHQIGEEKPDHIAEVADIFAQALDDVDVAPPYRADYGHDEPDDTDSDA